MSGSSSDDGSTTSISPALREELDIVKSTLAKADECVCRIEARIVQARLTPSHEYSDSYGRLPELSILQFNGNMLRWFNFWSCFNDAVHLRRSLRSTTKFQYLLQAVQGEPHCMLNALEITDANYEIAIQ